MIGRLLDGAILDTGSPDPLTLFSLVKGIMITLGETKLGDILGITATGPRIYGKTFASLN